MYDSLVDEALIAKVTAYVRDYMQRYDPSHDFNHIRRVVRTAQAIYAAEEEKKGDGEEPGRRLSLSLVTLAALMHDVGDRKYIEAGQDATTLVRDALLSLGCAAAVAEAVQAVCSGVSYSGEARDPGRVRAVLAAHPELGVVQDADRLDALGAVGVGRAFAFGAARGQTLGASVGHFDEKLLRLEGMMKTETGRRMARERSERLRMVREWWREETEGVEEEVN
ncbi:Uncharacterized protein ESCO_006204 [Escovopsis weberi]|uniref:HD/PDEase domain-containing protein n=1 Tax=Escovopsis weberi TaxID=150374 RepID=A0A0M8N438_ESCWE|nr:Uncharacterized protein ESCO_006204 [Escovopsis weberi]